MELAIWKNFLQSQILFCIVTSTIVILRKDKDEQTHYTWTLHCKNSFQSEWEDVFGDRKELELKFLICTCTSYFCLWIPYL